MSTYDGQFINPTTLFFHGQFLLEEEKSDPESKILSRILFQLS